jgi:hypothetical protein
VAKRTTDGDYRWINRGGVDLLGANPEAKESAYGLPRAKALYGPLPKQLKDPKSFASRLKRMLAARREHRIAESELLAAPGPKHSGACLLVMRLPDKKGLAITALNFAREAVTEEIDVAKAAGVKVETLRGGKVLDILAGEGGRQVSEAGRLTIKLDGLTGKTLVILSPSR